jgi:hypothetical protein
MRLKMRRFGLVTAIILACLLVAAEVLVLVGVIAMPGSDATLSEPPGGLKEGDPAPEFVLGNPAQDMTETLSDYKGKKPVVLVFASFT